jgi:hypothetical protein
LRLDQRQVLIFADGMRGLRVEVKEASRNCQGGRGT